jgi:hypothetical protein
MSHGLEYLKGAGRDHVPRVAETMVSNLLCSAEWLIMPRIVETMPKTRAS